MWGSLEGGLSYFGVYLFWEILNFECKNILRDVRNNSFKYSPPKASWLLVINASWPVQMTLNIKLDLQTALQQHLTCVPLIDVDKEEPNASLRILKTSAAESNTWNPGKLHPDT